MEEENEYVSCNSSSKDEEESCVDLYAYPAVLKNQGRQLPAVNERAAEAAQSPKPQSLQSQSGSSWKVALLVLLMLILLLQVVILGIAGQIMIAQITDTAATCTTSAVMTGTGGDINSQTSHNFTEWAEGITENIYDILQSSNNQSCTTVEVGLSAQQQQLTNIVSTLSTLKDTSNSTAGVIDDILLVVNQLLELQNGFNPFNYIQSVSCKDIKSILPISSPSGYYHVNNRSIYCNMGELCGSGGGWTRLAYLNMNDSTENCPSEFRLYQSGGIRSCGRQTSVNASCVSVQYPSNGISYSQVCGRVVGYNYGAPNAVLSRVDLNSWYVDGVSITRGCPRQHVWTLMAGYVESHIIGLHNCPCSNDSTQQVQSFIGSHYFCESANIIGQSRPPTSDPLWDGQGCGSNEAACCLAPGLPWFHRDYGNTTTTDYLELRVCGDEATNNEDSPVAFYEIYVK